VSAGTDGSAGTSGSAGTGGSTDAGSPISIRAEAMVFGFPPAPVEISVLRRASSWRVGGAVRTFAIFVVVAPFAALVPPHAPWAIGALGLGAILGSRRLKERFTLVSARGACPRCAEPLAVKGGRLRSPHPVSCDACHHQAALRFPEAALEVRIKPAGDAP
jgi:hypothetical protein